MSAEECTGSPGGGSLSPRGSRWRTVPLNSRRVTAPILRCVAVNLGVPTSASAEELRQMIDGRLIEQGREPRDVQAVIEPGGTDALEHVLLQDNDGVFLEADLVLTVTEDGGEREHPIRKPLFSDALGNYENLFPIELAKVSLLTLCVLPAL